MAGQTPERARESKRKYYEKNREAVIARSREWREANPGRVREQREARKARVNEQQRARYAADPGYREKVRQAQADYRTQNRDKINERSRAARARDPEKIRQQQRAAYARNQQKERAKKREHHAANRDKNIALMIWRKHGLWPHDLAALYAAQRSRCYLCGNAMTLDEAIIEHDHSCCPPERSCQVCRRGLAHSNCNSAIGMSGDDPGQLRRMADALEAAQLKVKERKASAYEQLELGA